MSAKNSSVASTQPKGVDTAHLYGKEYFQGGQAHSNYDDYSAQSLGPSRHLADTLFKLFRPASAVDVGCAVGHSVKRLRELGVEAHGYDISAWAVSAADASYIEQLDVSVAPIERKFDLVYSYDVVEHVPVERLKYVISNLWASCNRDMVIVPALYPEGTTHDPNEPTHLIFHDRAWWHNFMVNECNCIVDHEMTERLAAEEHSKVFDYSSRIFVFSKLRSRGD